MYLDWCESFLFVLFFLRVRNQRLELVFIGVYLWQYRTKSVWRLCTPSACKFPVIFHKNAREYIKYSLRFLFHLTKNLTTHLSHNLCAVLPYVFSANFVAYCVKNSCHTKVCLQIFALSAKKFARKSAYISYEHKLLEKNPRFEKNGESLVRMTGLEFYSPDVPTCCNIHFISYLRHFFILRCSMLLPFTLPF